MPWVNFMTERTDMGYIVRKDLSDTSKKIMEIAIDNGWSGLRNFEGDGHVIIALVRNDESLGIEWLHNDFHVAHYYIFDRMLAFTTLKDVGDVVRGWPDLIELFKWFPNANKPFLTTKYRRLPFALDADNEEILAKIVERPVFWWDAGASKIRVDVVMKPKGAKTNRIVDMGHRKLLHFNGARDGFKSLLVDAILKVG